MKRLLPIVLLASAICSSCRTVRVVEQVPVHVHDTLRLTQTLRDSIYIDHFREVTQKNDTIFVTNEVTKSKIVTKTDTAYRYIERPVSVVRTEQVEVKKPLRWWQKGLMWTGAIGIFVAALAVILRLRKH